MYQDPYEVVVRDESPLKTIYDLKGKKVSVGAMGSGIEGKTRIIFKIYGLTYDDIDTVFLGSNKGVNALKDGVVDAAVVMGYPPTRAIVSISTVRKVRILPMKEEMITRITTEHPFLSPFTILPNTYKNQPATIRVVAENSSICFSSKMPDDTVYKIVKTTFEHLDYLGKIHQAGKRLSLEKACSLKIGVPYHPGAIRYFKEVGIWKE
jgi:TRAP transporter TAXI family solute receptor